MTADLPPRRPVPAMTARSLAALLSKALHRMDELGYPPAPPRPLITDPAEVN